MTLESGAWNLFERLWNHYTERVADARKIEKALRERNDVWSEDHVAFRTLPGEHTGLHTLQALFEAFGYRRRDHYFFADKQLNAYWFEPPVIKGRSCEKVLPKLFVSELILERFPADFRRIIERATAQVTSDPLKNIKDLSAKASAGDEKALQELVETAFFYLTEGPSWARPLLSEYEVLRKESEYAAWTLLFGSRINHFTVSVQLMKSFSSLKGLNDFIAQDLRIPLNAAGGLIKGTPELRLEQSSTLACELPVLFQDGVKKLPYAFVEFAYRHPLEGQKNDGQWESYYQGFVVNNADKIFESTNVRP